MPSDDSGSDSAENSLRSLCKACTNGKPGEFGVQGRKTTNNRAFQNAGRGNCARPRSKAQDLSVLRLQGRGVSERRTREAGESYCMSIASGERGLGVGKHFLYAAGEGVTAQPDGSLLSEPSIGSADVPIPRIIEELIQVLLKLSSVFE